MGTKNTLDDFERGAGVLALLVGGLYLLFYGGKWAIASLTPSKSMPPASDGSGAQTASNDSGASLLKSFPLRKLTGKSLHTDNHYVADVQDVLNKYFGYNLDVDGAYGQDTETAVMETFGQPDITREMYNQFIAPKVGKPLV